MPRLEERPDIVWQTAMADWCSLAAYLMQPPTIQVIEQLRQASMADDLRAVVGELGMSGAEGDALGDDLDQLHGELTAIPAEEALGMVRREWTRVFAHPKAPLVWPYEGVFCDTERVLAGKPSTESRLFVNPAAMDAERRYKAAGYVSANREHPADFVVTELEFLAILHTRLAQALLASDDSAAEQAKIELVSFWHDHVACWMPRFFERCREESCTPYYKAAGRLGGLLMQAEVAIAGR